MIIAQGQRRTSAALGYGAEGHPLPFFWFGALTGWRAKPEEGEGGYGVASTQGGGLGGLAPGYYLAAPLGRWAGGSGRRRTGELPAGDVRTSRWRANANEAGSKPLMPWRHVNRPILDNWLAVAEAQLGGS
jgi:hypothetical protein